MYQPKFSHLTNNGDNMDADGEQGCRPPSAYHRPQRTGVRSCKYLNNVVEQDHRRIKQRIRPMLGLKRFETAAVTIRGIPNGRENQKTTVQPQSNNRRSNHRSGNLGRGPGRLKSAKPLAR
jgi:transposase-like protein